MARIYWVQPAGGRKVYGEGTETIDQVEAYAERLASQLGRDVEVGYVDRAAKKARTMRRNPDPFSYLDVWEHKARAVADRARYMAATKARRLAKSLRGRAGQEAEAAHRKTARYVVVAVNRKERFTLYRPSKRAADVLAGEFEAAGYNVAVKPA